MSERRSYLLRRLVYSVFSVFVIATLLFIMFRTLPGDPTAAAVDPGMPPEVRESLRETFGLTEPLHIQYYYYMINFVQGDLGVSFFYLEPVTSILLRRTLNTLVLMLTAVLLAYVLGTLLGAYLAWRRGTPLDTAAIAVLLFFRGAPAFWTGMLAIMIFSFTFNLFPSGGMTSPHYIGISEPEHILDVLWHLILPVTVTTLYYLNLPAFIMRNTMIDVMKEDFVDYYRGMGVSELSVLYRHVVRNSLLPVTHRAAISIAFAFSGSVVIETVFSWPGVGRTMWQAVLRHDFPLAQGAFLVLAIAVITMNFLVDLISVYIDPRATTMESQ